MNNLEYRALLNELEHYEGDKVKRFQSRFDDLCNYLKDLALYPNEYRFDYEREKCVTLTYINILISMVNRSKDLIVDDDCQVAYRLGG